MRDVRCILSLCVTLLAGCVPSLGPFPDTVECSSDADCPQGRCNLVRGLCYVGEAPAQPGVSVSAAAIETDEAGTAATFTVVLTAAPLADVRVIIDNPEPTELDVSPLALDFTPSDWNVAKVVTVSGKADCLPEADESITLALGPTFSDDAPYHGIEVSSVEVLISEVANHWVEISASTPLITAEDGSSTAFAVSLECAPVAPVVLTFTSAAAGEGEVLSPAGGVLTIDPTNWTLEVSVVVGGVDDARADGDRAYQIDVGVSSGDPRYDGLSIASIEAENIDDDRVGISVATSAAITDEAGAEASVAIRLDSEPYDDVIVPLSVTPTEGVIVSPGPSLTFTAANWNVPQEVRIAGVPDQVDDGDVSYDLTIGPAASDDAAYDGVSASPVSLTNVDIDTAGVSVLTKYLSVNEGGRNDALDLALLSKPITSVTITASADAPIVIEPTSLVIDGSNWDHPLTFTVSASEDATDAAGGDPLSVTLDFSASADAAYAALPSRQIDGTRHDEGSRVIYLAGSSTGEISGAPDIVGVAGADALCNAPSLHMPGLAYARYRAFLVDGVTRVACTTANCVGGGASEHVDWPLLPNTLYRAASMNPPGTPLPVVDITVTDAFGLPGTITNAFGGGIGAAVWSGLNADFTTSSSTCSGWTTDDSGIFGSSGNAAATNTTAWSAVVQPCDQQGRVLCVEW